jgi:hypothetical protein
MMRLVFPPHIVDLMVSGHRVVVENLDSTAVLALHIYGFAGLCARVPMSVAVSRVMRIFEMISKVITHAGLEKIDNTQDTYLACAIAGYAVRM